MEHSDEKTGIVRLLMLQLFENAEQAGQKDDSEKDEDKNDPFLPTAQMPKGRGNLVMEMKDRCKPRRTDAYR